MRKSFWIGYLCIAVITSICYFPSLLHMPRADHIAYLAEVASKKSFCSLVIQSADIPRTRLFIPGDQILFRPIVFSFLGLEKYLFSYNFSYWQITGIALHLLVLFFLLKLLLNVRRSIAAFVLTAFFSVMFIPMEMVIWEQINGYMIFMIAILIALDQIYSYINLRDEKFWRLIVVGLSLLVACFTYETANLFVFLIFIYFCMNASREKRTWLNKLMIIGPVGVYIISDVLDWFVYSHLGNTHPAASLPSQDPLRFLLSSLMNWGITNLSWFLFGFIPSQFDFILENGSRLFLSVDRWFALFNCMSILLVIAFILIIFKARTKGAWLKWNFSTLLAWLIAFYSLTISVGRVNDKGFSVLTLNVYYSYIFWVLLLILVYSCVDFEKLRRSKLHRLKWFVFGILFVLTLFSGYRVFQTNAEMAVMSKDSRNLVQAIEQLRRAHQKDSNFSIYITDTFPGNFMVSWLGKTGDPPGKRYSFIEALYLDCFDRVNPRFSIH